MDLPPRVVCDTTLATAATRLVGLGSSVVAIGPLAMSVQVDASRAQALVTASFGTQIMQRQVLTLLAPTLTLDIAWNAMAAKGTVTLLVQAPPAWSSLAADLTACQGTTVSPFRGELASWLATDEPVIVELDFVIGPELSTHTTVRGLDGANAEMAFLSGDLALAFKATTQSWPQATFEAIKAGSVDIAAGATITLTIPSSLQQGMLVLQAIFPKAPADSQHFTGAVANWPLP